ncbi:MAG: hypothetical protein R2813_06540 [Flavobacteriales bacterium]
MILVFNNFLGNNKETIKSDGFGYYDYLVSIFIENDLVRKDFTILRNPEEFERTRSLENGKVAFGIYLPYGERNVNKYSCGEALMLAPFFLATLSTLPDQTQLSGYEKPFQMAVFYGALFYVFLGLIFFRLLCALYLIKPWLIFVMQITMVFGTGVLHYSYFDAAFSHVYSMSAMCAFLYTSKAWFEGRSFRYLICAAALFGMVFLLRQVNVLVILALPFLAGSTQVIRERLSSLIANPIQVILGVIAFSGVASIQFILWYLQTGDFILYSYQNEGFNFLQPRWADLLFSYQKGLFVYYPVLLFSLVAVVWMFSQKRVYEALTWLFWFVAVVYVSSAWWSWDYGASFGQRPFIDYLPLFFLVIGMMFSALAIWKVAILTLIMSLSVPFNLIQTYQYQHFILHWHRMNKESYWKVFLKTDLKYRYWIWGRNPQYNKLKKVHEVLVGDITIKEASERVIFSLPLDSLYSRGWFDVCRVSFENEFALDENGSMIARIVSDNPSEPHFIHGVPLFQFEMEGTDKLQTGSYGFKWEMINEPNAKFQLLVRDVSDTFHLKDLKLIMYSRS